MFLKAYVKDSSLEDLIWSDSYKSRAAHQLKSISSMQRAEEPFTPYPNFVSLVGSQAGRATGASPEPHQSPSLQESHTVLGQGSA